MAESYLSVGIRVSFLGEVVQVGKAFCGNTVGTKFWCVCRLGMMCCILSQHQRGHGCEGI